MLNVREVQEVFVAQNCKTNVPFWSHVLIQSWCVGVKSSIFVHIRQLIQVLAQWLCCSPDMHFTSAYPFVLFHHRIEIFHHDQFLSHFLCSAPLKQILADSTWPHIHNIIIHAYPSHKVWISLLKAFNLLLWVSPLDSWDWSGNGCVHPGTPCKFKGEPT